MGEIGWFARPEPAHVVRFAQFARCSGALAEKARANVFLPVILAAVQSVRYALQIREVVI